MTADKWVYIIIVKKYIKIRCTAKHIFPINSQLAVGKSFILIL